MIKVIVENWKLAGAGVFFLIGIPAMIYLWVRFLKKKVRQEAELMKNNEEMVESMIDHGM